MFDYKRTARLGYTGRAPRAHNAQSYFWAATALIVHSFVGCPTRAAFFREKNIRGCSKGKLHLETLYEKAFAFVVTISNAARLSPQSKQKKGESSMVQPTPLHYVNRGEPGQTRSFNCGNILGSERCSANTSQGPKLVL
jgi:hypothetical protein